MYITEPPPFKPSIAIGRPFSVQGKARTTTSKIPSRGTLKNWDSWKIDVNPSVLASNPYNQEIGLQWLKNAEAEHASVASFARFTLQLMSIGAPSDLLVESQKAALDEIKHAKMSYGLASKFIGTNFVPGPLDVTNSLENMDLKEITQSLIQEGCIGETLSAIEAHFAAERAGDAAVKEALLEIGTDETKHAQLAWNTIYWITRKYPNIRTFVEETFGTKLEQSRMTTKRGAPITSCLESDKDDKYRKYGLLIKEDRDKVREAGIRDVITPVYSGGFKNAGLISQKIIQLKVLSI